MKSNYILKKIIIIIFTALFFTGSAAFANKTSVEIEAPSSARKGSVITIKIKISHRGNNFFHYTNLVFVKVNDEVLKMWEYKAYKRPEKENFTLELSYTVTGPVKITAIAYCNLHGSAGEKSIELLAR